MGYKIVLGHHLIKIDDFQSDMVKEFKASDYYKKCYLTGACEFFIRAPEYCLDGAFIRLVDSNVIFGYKIDNINLYLLDDQESNYITISSLNHFSEIVNPVYFSSLFNVDDKSDLSFADFVHTLKHTPKLFKFWEYFKNNKDSIAKWYGASNDAFLVEEYTPDFYSSSQGYVRVDDVKNNHNVVGEIKTKIFHGRIKPHT